MVSVTRIRTLLGGCLALAIIALSVIPESACAQGQRPATVGVEDPLLVEAQSVLRLLGHYTGRLDGQTGPRTSQALTDFQRAQNIPQSGRLDDRTLALLRQQRDTKLSGQLGSPNSGPQPAPMSNLPPGPIAAQPVERVEAAPIGQAGPPGKTGKAPADFTGSGTRPPLGSPSAPSLFSIPPANQPTPMTPVLPPPPVVASKTVGAFGLTSWDWLIPFAGVPLFIVLWRIASRRTRPQPLLADGPRQEPSVASGGPKPAGNGFTAPASDRAQRPQIQPRLRRTLGRRSS